MKKLSALFFGLLFFLMTGSAQAHPVRTFVSWTPNAVTAEVFNQFPFPVHCQANLSARVTFCNGYNQPQWQATPMNWIWPGQYRYAYMYQNLWCAAYTGAWANVSCVRAY